MHLAPRELRPVAQPDRFYDGGSDSEPPDPARAARIVLERVDHRPVEVFAMLRRVAYRDQVHGELLVPADLATFRTDLASVPALFTWLVPRTGHHLAPALVHDALVRQPQEHLGAAMDRVAADEVFRRAMRDTHVRTVRRWLVWAAVTLATIHLGSSSWSRRRHLRYRLTAYASLALIAALGTIATLDLVDVVDWLPWMGRRPWWLELTGGLAAAIVVPLLIGCPGAASASPARSPASPWPCCCTSPRCWPSSPRSTSWWSAWRPGNRSARWSPAGSRCWPARCSPRCSSAPREPRAGDQRRA